MKRILILLSFLAISCQSNSGEMSRQAGQASNELMNGLEAMHHVRFAEARALFLEGIEKDPNCASCYLNLGNAEQDRVLRREYLETALSIAKKGHPETKIMEQGLFLQRLSDCLEESKNKIEFPLPVGSTIFSNNYFWLHGRKPFKENTNLSRELLRIRGTFFN